MAHEIITGSAIIISDNPELNTSLQSLLYDSGYDPVTVCTDTSEADEQISAGIPELLMIDIPEGDTRRLGIAAEVAGYGIAAVAIVSSEMYRHYLLQFKGKGIYLLPKPISGPMLAIALDWLISTRERLSRLADLNSSAIERKIDELKLVNRAKWLLITELKMDEPRAHRYIEKQAMDRSMTKREVAAEIIRTYSK